MTSANEELARNRDLIYRFTEECWNQGDLAKVPELVAENCRHHDALFPHMAAGSASMQHHIERVRRAFPDVKFTITDAVCRDDEVEVQWGASATQVAEFLGIPASKQRASITGTSRYRIESGKVVENWVTWDVMSLMKQLGGAAVAKVVQPLAKAG